MKATDTRPSVHGSSPLRPRYFSTSSKSSRRFASSLKSAAGAMFSATSAPSSLRQRREISAVIFDISRLLYADCSMYMSLVGKGIFA